MFSNGIKVSWLKNGEVVKDDVPFTNEWNGTKFMITASSLDILDATMADSGTYSCKTSVVNEDRNVVSTSFNIVVISKSSYI